MRAKLPLFLSIKDKGNILRLRTLDPLTRKEIVQDVPKDFKRGLPDLTPKDYERLILRNADFSESKSFVCSMDGGIGDVVIAADVVLGLKAYLKRYGRKDHEWIGVHDLNNFVSRFLTAASVFDRIVDYGEAECLFLKYPAEFLDIRLTSPAEAQIALGSNWDYLWARWGLPGRFPPTEDKSYLKGVKRAARQEYMALRPLWHLPESSRYIFLSPESYTLKAHKSWPISYWRLLIDRIIKTTKLNVVIGTTKDRFNEYAKGDVRCLLFDLQNRRVKRDLLALTAVVENAQAVVAVDSGPAHMAGFLEIPCITLWGPTFPVIYGHRNNMNLRVSSCPPCMNDLRRHICADNVCMKEITAESVWSLLKEVLDGRYAPR